jgi:hypothetical protein
MGRKLHDSLDLALGEKIETFDLPMPEIVPAYQVTIKLHIEEDTSGDIPVLNSKSIIESVIRPIKNANSGPNNVTLSTNSHAALSDRSANKQHPSTAIWNNPTSSNVEQAITDIYTHIYNTYTVGELRYTRWTEQVVVNQTGLWLAINGVDATPYADAYLYLLENYPSAFSDVDVYANPSAMTANDAPSPYITSTSNQYSNTYAAWKAFDKDDSSYWRTAAGVYSNSVGNEWIQIQIPEPVKLIKINIRSGGASLSYIPDNFTLQGSNDGTTFNDILVVTSAGMTSMNTWYSFNIPSMDTAYSYFRLVVTKVRGAVTTYCIISEIQLLKEHLILKDLKDVIGNTAYIKVA